MNNEKLKRILDAREKKEKGDKYEIFICEELNKSIFAWRWSFVPEYILLDAKLLTSQEEARLKRKINYLKSNPIIDNGIDIVCKNGDKYILIQCKDHEGMISQNKLISFFNKMDTFNQYEGRVYYTNSLCTTVQKYYNENCINKNIQFIQYQYPKIKQEIQELKLRKYQEDAINALNNHFVNNKRRL